MSEGTAICQNITNFFSHGLMANVEERTHIYMSWPIGHCLQHLNEPKTINECRYIYFAQ